jgi:CHAT domain-containing protein
VLNTLGLNRGSPAPSVAEVAAAGVAAVVTLTVSESGGLAFIVPAGVTTLATAHVLELPGMTTAEVSRLLANADGTGWFDGYGRFHQDLVRTEGHGSASGLNAWNDTVVRLLEKMWDELMRPLSARLDLLGVADGGEVVIVPSGRLSSLPLHAAGTQADDGTWHTFMDRWRVSYAPSLQAAVTSRMRAVETVRQSNKLLAITNPIGPEDTHSDLGVEDNPACHHFESSNVVHLRGAEATVDRVAAELADATYVSFFCHGHWSFHDPDSSHLRLAGGQLTVADLGQIKFDKARHAWLGACESALTGLDLPDEFLGLPGSLMQAGVPGVGATLWPVFNRHTETLMHSFYERHRSVGDSPIVAMQSAVQSLRLRAIRDVAPSTKRLRAAVARPETYSAMGFLDNDGRDSGFSSQAASIFHDTSAPIHWAAFIYVGA